MFGTVRKTSRNTVFRLEVKMDNGCTISESQIVYNWELDQNPAGYGITLDYLTAKLDKRLKDRFQTWMRE